MSELCNASWKRSSVRGDKKHPHTHCGDDGNSQMFPVQDIPTLVLNFHMLDQFIQVLRCRT